ncbi:tRNA1(Val) (adenine(37)-N6)-methyltransferase [Neomegalonema perideroedes]|uniref:tRNA1(Val) (adenine(37)-N6)-methyltransferase n=1 Tax=Neomegalonema perideroedes TaxID=217219 RepID=UPI00038130B3|nr:methyltransferase [Neomegalonema perideroedes]
MTDLPEAADLTENRMLGGGLVLRQPRKGFRSASDAALLAAAVPALPGERVLDWGSGAGAAGLCLGRRVGGLDLHGLEGNPAMAALSEANAAANGLAWRVHIGRVEAPPAGLKALEFDHVLTNPPYFPAGFAASPEILRDEANRESAALAVWLRGALKRLRPGGSLTVVQRVERLPEILAALEGGAGSWAILPLAPKSGLPAKLILLRGIKGGRSPLRLAFPLILHQADGAFTPEAEAILREGRALAF